MVPGKRCFRRGVSLIYGSTENLLLGIDQVQIKQVLQVLLNQPLLIMIPKPQTVCWQDVGDLLLPTTALKSQLQTPSRLCLRGKIRIH